ncbi:winged helix-turn-helix domain-containing protein [Actinokineospora auranticolor]|uniref:winged helix-turn-helix domain-containing protein n=1 Tax=Actinokineospora auranticolor TaxID=155976 RepID=UPI000CEC87C9|nr:winged helix-turn-helix domain-containing protein [Actinokineospora auranticolor]
MFDSRFDTVIADKTDSNTEYKTQIRHDANDNHRITFTDADLARTRVAPTLGRAAETVFALEAYTQTRTRTGFEAWRRTAHNALAQRSPALLGHLQGLGRSRAARQALLSGDPAEQRTVALLREFHAVAVAPYWASITAELEAERECRGRALLAGGIEELFGTLHPRVRWQTPNLVVAGRGDQVALRGRGLVLAPSLFLSGPPRTIVPVAPDRPVTLAYPISLDRAALTTVWSGGRQDARALGPLLGRTRAAMLVALTDSRASVELSRSLEISSAAVSQHTSILRAAGLIFSRRDVNSLCHTLTPLGEALLRGTCRAG